MGLSGDWPDSPGGVTGRLMGELGGSPGAGWALLGHTVACSAALAAACRPGAMRFTPSRHPPPPLRPTAGARSDGLLSCLHRLPAPAAAQASGWPSPGLACLRRARGRLAAAATPRRARSSRLPRLWRQPSAQAGRQAGALQQPCSIRQQPRACTAEPARCSVAAAWQEHYCFDAAPTSSVPVCAGKGFKDTVKLGHGK